MRKYLAILTVIVLVLSLGSASAETFNSDGLTLVDDDRFTIVSHGKGMIDVQTSAEQRPAYLLSITNKSNCGVGIYTGHMDEDIGDYHLGTINGAEISALCFIDPQDEQKYEGICFSPIFPGTTKDLYMEPFGGGYGFTSTDELTNVVVDIHLSSVDYDSWYCNYTLVLDEGEIVAYDRPSDVVQYENDIISYELPSDWKRDIFYEGTEYEYELVWAPPSLSLHLTHIEIRTNPIWTLQEMVDAYNQEHQAYYADPLDSMTTYDAVIDGHSAEVLEDYNHIADATTYTYFIHASGEKLISIQFISETQFKADLDAIRQQILDSIRFKA